MARYIDVEGYRKLFDEEYKETRKLISEGETHLDNLAEGFSEASKVIDRMPTADVVPKSEVENFNKSKGGFCPLCGSYIITKEMMEELRMAHKELGQHGDPVGEKGILAEEAIKADVAREIFAEIEECMAHDYISTIGVYNGALELRIAELKKKHELKENL